MSSPTSHTWQWEFSRPVEAVWPLLADTVRFNEAAGFPRYAVREESQPDGSVRYFAEQRVGLYQLSWEEIPSNWIENRWFVHERLFSQGPFRRMHVDVCWEPRGSSCFCRYTLTVEPANLMGRLLLLCGFFRSTGDKFSLLVRGFRDFLAGTEGEPFHPLPPQLPIGAVVRCRQLAGSLAASPLSHNLHHRLADWILTRPDSEIGTLRPKTLARIWKTSERTVTELCLLAAHRGLLSLRWDLLCPNCRVGKATFTHLDEVPTEAHCGTCNIAYDRDFNRNVEVVFAPARTIRPVPLGEYCLFGPRSTPHIVAQLRVEAGATRREEVTLAPAHYRIRTLEPGPALSVDHGGGSFPRVMVGPSGELSLAPSNDCSSLVVENRGFRFRTLILERREGMTEITTAADVARSPVFRELFHDQVLRPGDFVRVDSVVLLFTDVRASASLYESIGDAAAYALVREHFAILSACVRRHGGTVVKTIGDAVMASFADPAGAFRCSLNIQRDFAAFNLDSTDLSRRISVKIGLHLGPCICVTLNGFLDYYGQTANLSARLASLAQGGDIVLSLPFAQDSSVGTLLNETTHDFFEAQIKGFSHSIRYVRVTPAPGHGDGTAP